MTKEQLLQVYAEIATQEELDSLYEEIKYMAQTSYHSSKEASQAFENHLQLLKASKRDNCINKITELLEGKGICE